MAVTTSRWTRRLRPISRSPIQHPPLTTTMLLSRALMRTPLTTTCHNAETLRIHCHSRLLGKLVMARLSHLPWSEIWVCRSLTHFAILAYNFRNFRSRWPLHDVSLLCVTYQIKMLTSV